MAYEGVDFYDIDSLLTDEERTVRDTVRAWVSERVIPIIEQHYLDGTFPTELIREMGEMGFLGANIHGYECPGLNNVCYGLICQELERGDSAIRSFASVQGSLVMFPISAYGTEELALEAIHRGAYDYLEKPVDRKRLTTVVRKGLERATLRKEVIHLRREMVRSGRLQNFVGHSPTMLEVYRLIEQLAPTNASVLVVGESGEDTLDAAIP